MVDKVNSRISISRQVELLGISRSSVYYKKKIKEDEQMYERLITEIHEKRIFYGSRKITEQLRRDGYQINKKRVARIMRKLGIKAVHPKPNTSKARKEDKKFPYLLKNIEINKTNQVWSTDITYIRILGGFIYLVAIIDWNSRYILSWEISTTLETYFCTNALQNALRENKRRFNKDNPEIFNTDQGSQFTSNEFIQILQEHNIQISMDGKGRCLDNIFIERFWRTVKYEEIYLKEYSSVREIYDSIKQYIDFYNNERFHESLNYKTPYEVFTNQSTNKKRFLA